MFGQFHFSILAKSVYQKIHTHYNLYKIVNRSKKFLIFKYIIWALFYRRFLCYVLALPLLCIYVVIYPFVKFRFFRLFASAMGHYAINTECLLSKLDTLADDRFINIFYLEYSLFEPNICNSQLHNMWRRSIFIIPPQFSGIVMALDKLIMLFLANKAYGLCGNKIILDNRGLSARDTHSYLKKARSHLSFTLEEHRFAKHTLEKINIKPHDRYVCLLVRSNAYNKGHPVWDKPYRNANLSSYIKACQFLAKKGYYVLRMGKAVDDNFAVNHPKIIDYARSDIRSDFMDIYLSAHCYFFITTGTGLDNVAQIFRRPILYTNCFIMAYVHTWYPHRIFIPKVAAFKESNKILTFKENFNYLCDNSHNPDFNIFNIGDYLEKKKLYLIANTEDEILEATEEMEARMINQWQESEEDKQLQKKFWKLFPINAVHYNTTVPLHGDISIKIGAKFLSKYRDFLT